jgi:dihydrofolate reductase
LQEEEATMPITTADMMMSLDGYTAGPNQTRERPFGDGPVEELERWMFEGVADNRAEVEAVVGAQAYIMGRKMFSPERAPFDPDWIGWWGEEPPYRAPVFVLCSEEREPIELTGTTFHFVTGGIHEALRRAGEVTGDGHVAIAGGAATINQYLAAGLVDELTLHIAPVVLGAGERLFDGVSGLKLEQLAARSASLATHIDYRVVR